MTNQTAFKRYDIRGIVPDQLDESLARRIGWACAQQLKARRMVVGHDMRLSSPSLTDALVTGLRQAGVDVTHIGLCGTEEIYFATAHQGFDGGIMVTASHNPADYNGMKMVAAQAKPFGANNELQQLALKSSQPLARDLPLIGKVHHQSDKTDYLQHLLASVKQPISPLKVVTNGGNGCAGPVVDQLAGQLPINLIPLLHEPNGHFPHGVPNPLLPECRQQTAQAVLDHGADLGVAWDGDFDRCFFFDEQGQFIEGYYVVGLLAQWLLQDNPGQTVLYDPRLIWNSQQKITASGGHPQPVATGHVFFKQAMHELKALYGGEMSGHHYFRDFFNCDSGMLPWLLVMQIMTDTGKPLSALINQASASFPCSGEHNFTVDQPEKIMQRIAVYYGKAASSIDYLDGLSMEFAQWRFNLRCSNTEPLLRLNVESCGNINLLQQKFAELSRQIQL